MRPDMGRDVLQLILMSPLCAGVADAALQPTPALKLRQTILEANRYLIDEGWQPSPKAFPSPEERRWSAVPLSSLSNCSGTKDGFEFDYQKHHQQFSVTTVPRCPGQQSVGQVSRWW